MDIYEIILKDKIDSQNHNLKITPSLFSKSIIEGADFDKSNFYFFSRTLKLVFRFLKSFLSHPKSNHKQALNIYKMHHTEQTKMLRD